MSYKPTGLGEIPAETRRVAKAAFPSGNDTLRLRDELGMIYTADQFADLYPTHGQPGVSPALLALVLVLQFLEGLTDRQAADAVRARIDWKYALGLELTDAGFDYSVLSEFRDRLIENAAAQRLLDQVLEAFRARGLIKARGKQRTDSTHVLAAVRRLNRLELALESLRQALNEVARAQPEWLRQMAVPAWFDRYSKHWDTLRLPRSTAEREALAQVIGQDGWQLAQAIYSSPEQKIRALRELPAVELLRQVWVQQYYVEEGPGRHPVVRWRKDEEQPPTERRMDTPYDPEARYSKKRSTEWKGYKVHLTETCDDDAALHAIIHVETTIASEPDSNVSQTVHTALEAHALLPGEHLMDAGYVDAGFVVAAQHDQGVEVVGPVLLDRSWQAHEGKGFDLSKFRIDWSAREAICPQGQSSIGWVEHRDRYGSEIINVSFGRQTCEPCPVRTDCTRGTQRGRTLAVRPQAQHEVLQRMREYQETEAFRARYKKRAGIEGTISQGVRAFSLRHTRYVGLAKTRVQMLATAVAINLERFADYLTGARPVSRRVSPFAALAPA